MKAMDKDVRWDAAIALSARARAGMIKDARMVEPLIQALKNKYEYAYVRRTAAEALGEIGDEKAKEALTQALKDEDLDVQQAAKKALENIKGKKS